MCVPDSWLREMTSSLSSPSWLGSKGLLVLTVELDMVSALSYTIISYFFSHKMADNYICCIGLLWTLSDSSWNITQWLAFSCCLVAYYGPSLVSKTTVLGLHPRQDMLRQKGGLSVGAVPQQCYLLGLLSLHPSSASFSLGWHFMVSMLWWCAVEWKSVLWLCFWSPYCPSEG